MYPKGRPMDQYTAKEVVGYIKEAYGRKVKKKKVTLGLPSPADALSLLGYEYDYEDRWWPFSNPKRATPKYTIGQLVEVKGDKFDKHPVYLVMIDGITFTEFEGGVEEPEYSVSQYQDYEMAGKCAWYNEDELSPVDQSKLS